MRSITEIWQRRRWSMLAIWSVVFGLIAVWALLASDEFRSGGTLYLRLGRENIGVDPTANFGQGQISAVPLTRETEINTVVETLKSRTLLEKVTDEVSPEAILADQKRWIDYVRRPKMPAREYAIMRLEKMIRAGTRRKSNLVFVTVDARDPELARDAAVSLIKHFVNYHRDLNSNPDAHEFFQQQADLLQGKLVSTEDKLTKLRNDVGVASAPEQKRLLMERLAAVEAQVQQTEADIKQARSAIETLSTQKKTLPERLIVQKAVVANQAVDGMREQLYDLELREKLLSARLTADHPELMQIRDQVAQAKKIYAGEEAARTNVTEGRNRAYEQTELTLLDRQSELATLLAKQEVLQPQLESLRSRLRDLNEADIQLARLERDLEVESTSYLKYAHSREETRIDESLRREQISNISIAEHPVVSYEPIKPDRPVLLALGFTAATLLACSYAFAIEQWQSPTGSSSPRLLPSANGQRNGASHLVHSEHAAH